MKNFKKIILLTAFIICGIICLPCQLKASAAAAENENFARLNTDLQLLIDDNKNGVPGVGAAVIKNGRLVMKRLWAAGTLIMKILKITCRLRAIPNCALLLFQKFLLRRHICSLPNRVKLIWMQI